MKKRTIATQVQAITHIPLGEANSGKLAALNRLWADYKVLCQQYVTYFCTEAQPDPHAAFIFNSGLSARWQRVAVQQAAGLAQSWRSHRANYWADYQDRLAYYESLSE